MPRESFKGTLNFDNRDRKREFVAGCGALRGLYRVALEPTRDTRTTRQNSFYFLILSRAAKWLTEGGQRQYTSEQMHSAMGRRFLGEVVMDETTGEVLERYIRSTTTLSIGEMGEYIDQVQQRFDEKYGIPPLVPDTNAIAPATAGGRR